MLESDIITSKFKYALPYLGEICVGSADTFKCKSLPSNRGVL